MARRVFGEASVSKVDARATALLQWLRSNKSETFNAKTTRRKVGGILREAEDMSKACECLEGAGLIRRPTNAKKGPGRKSSNWEVHPVVWQ
jgi:hypothetical protein